MTVFRFTVSYEGEIEAPDPETARTWALEEVEHGHYLPAIVEAVPAKSIVPDERQAMDSYVDDARKDAP